MNSPALNAISSDTPDHDTGFMILYGSLAPQGAIAVLGPWRYAAHKAKARVFDDQASTLSAIMNRDLLPGDIVVQKSQGQEQSTHEQSLALMDLIAAITASGAQKIIIISEAPTPPQAYLRRHASVALISHLTPKAHQGGPLASIEDGQWIEIDPLARRLDYQTDDQVIRLKPAHSHESKTVKNRRKTGGPEARYRSIFSHS